jgi:DNA repair protein RecO (recombination protein O)
MPLVSTTAIVLSTLRYSETSKIVRLATREHGVQSVIAKGALRPRSRFGAALQLLSEGQAELLMKEGRDLHLLTAFELTRLHVGLAAEIERYAAACALAEVMLRFAPADPHPESFEVLHLALGQLEEAESGAVEALGFRLLWQLVGVLGFAPSMEACVVDGRPLSPAGTVAFSAPEGGVLCPECASRQGAAQLPAQSRADLLALLDATAPLPRLDARQGAAHRRLLARYIRHHLGEGGHLPALDFWSQRSWAAA